MGKRYHAKKASKKVKQATYRKQIRTIKEHVLAKRLQNPFTYYDLEEVGDAKLPEIGTHLQQFLAVAVEAGDLKKIEGEKVTKYEILMSDQDTMPEIVDRLMKNGGIARLLPKALHDLDDNGGPYEERDIGIAVEEISGISDIDPAHTRVVIADLKRRGVIKDGDGGTYIVMSAPTPAGTPPSPAPPPSGRKRAVRKPVVSEIPGIRRVDVPRIRKLFLSVKELEFRAVRENWASLGYKDQKTYTHRLHEAVKAGLLRHVKRGIYRFIMEKVPASWLTDESPPAPPPDQPPPPPEAGDEHAALRNRISELEADVGALEWVIARRIYEGYLEPLPRGLQDRVLCLLVRMEDGD